MRYERTIEIAASPEAVWGIMRDVERWHEWTASITSVTLIGGGPLAVGRKARVRQPKLPPAQWTVTDLEEGRGFTWVSRSPGATVTGRHEIMPLAGGSRVTLSILYEGPLGVLVGRLIRAINVRYLTLEAEGLKRRSESVR